jgi:hypothetical protein
MTYCLLFGGGDAFEVGDLMVYVFVSLSFNVAFEFSPLILSWTSYLHFTIITMWQDGCYLSVAALASLTLCLTFPAGW